METLAEKEKHRRLWIRHLATLSADIIIGIVEDKIKILPLSLPIKAILISGMLATYQTFSIWRETPPHERPSNLLRSLGGVWFTGAVLIWLVATGLGRATPSTDTVQSVSPAPSIPETPTIIPTITPTPSPTVTPSPTITLSPTYTFTPPPTSTPIVIVVTPTLTFTPTLPYGYAKVCQDAPPSPLAVERPGYICNPDKIRIRDKPSLRAKVIGSLTPGTRFLVIGGPECGDRRVWWKVRLYIEAQQAYTGMIGWMAETSPGGG